MSAATVAYFRSSVHGENSLEARQAARDIEVDGREAQSEPRPSGSARFDDVSGQHSLTVAAPIA